MRILLDEADKLWQEQLRLAQEKQSMLHSTYNCLENSAYLHMDKLAIVKEKMETLQLVEKQCKSLPLDQIATVMDFVAKTPTVRHFYHCTHL